MVLPRLVSTSAAISHIVTLMPKFSRMRSESPFPVNTPIRAHISCTTISATVIGMSVQRKR